MFYDYSNFINDLSVSGKENLLTVLKQGPKVGFHSYIISDMTLRSLIDPASKFIKEIKQVVLGTRISDQTAVTALNKAIKEPMLENQEAYFIYNKMARRIKEPGGNYDNESRV